MAAAQEEFIDRTRRGQTPDAGYGMPDPDASPMADLISGLGIDADDMAQMADNVATFERLDPLSPAEEAILFAAADKMKNSIPCTACRYCCDGCPQQLDIPDLLHKYNQLRTGSGSTIKMQLDAVPANKWPHACLGCGACAAVCPQKIVIPDELAAFAAELDKLPDWVEVCRQRAEAEARERASRGL